MDIRDAVVPGATIAVLGFFAFREVARRRAVASRSAGGALADYTRDLTALAAAGTIDPVCCRDVELERVIRILLRKTKNNPLLVGPPGVGKSAIALALALRVHRGEVPTALRGARVLELRLQDLMAGTRYRGELEERLRRITTALEASQRGIILAIDELHLLGATGRSEGSLGIADVLKPGLARGDYRVLGATTWPEYERLIRPDEALDRRFQVVLVEEPTREQAVAMLHSLRATYEQFHNVRITDAALEAAVRLADEAIDSRYLPDSAIDLIDEAAAKTAIEADRAYHIPIGAIHAAAKAKSTEPSGVVDVDDVEAAVAQWVEHARVVRERTTAAAPSS